jgi:FkbM family methyltransferase
MHGFFDWRNVVVASTLCSSGDVIVEVGANVGTETISFLDIVGRSGKVVALEPDPRLVARLRRNLAQADTTALRLLNAAASDKPGSMPFQSTSETTSSGTGHLIFGDRRPSTNSINVQVVRLDDVLHGYERVGLLAIDVEGAEERCLQGARQTLRQFRPFLIVEASEQNLLRAGSSRSAIRRLLRTESYAVHAIGRFGLRSVDSTSGDANWLAIPREREQLAERVDSAIRLAGLLPFRLGFLRRSR